MTDQEWYDYGHERCGIKRGDSVKVLRRADDHEMGWENTWTMDSSVGKTLTVSGDSGSGGLQLSDSYNYPFFVLELIRKKEAESPLPQSILGVINNERAFNYAGASIKKLVAEILKQTDKRYRHT